MPICTYCGFDGPIEREHVIPASYLAYRRSYDPSHNWLVPACDTCNRLASSKVFFSIAAKARYLFKRYQSRFRKALSVPFWDESELADMDYGLRIMIEGSMLAKAVLHRRLRHLEAVSEYSPDFARPKWVEALIREFEEEERKRKRRKQKTRAL